MSGDQGIGAEQLMTNHRQLWEFSLLQKNQLWKLESPESALVA